MAPSGHICFDRFPHLRPDVIHRHDVVKEIFQMIEEKVVVVVIRAPPRFGTSTLSSLICKEILRNHPHFEPIHILLWKPCSAEERLKEHYTEILARHAETARAEYPKVPNVIKTARYNNTGRRTLVYLIDNALNTYSESEMWEKEFERELARKGIGERVDYVRGYSIVYRGNPTG
ncbi:MAG: hypothetical protein Q9221_004447 [Calogaya cf. arnoldii]